MTTEPEKIGVDVWMAATIYVDAGTEEEAAQIVKERYAGSRDRPDTYDHMNGENLPLDGDDFMSSAITLYGLCDQSELVAAADTIRDAAPEMLAALITLVRRIERDNLHTTAGVDLACARTVIAKAGGAHE